MNKFGTLAVIFFVIGGLLLLSKFNLPPIIFPKEAQHKTIGELPIVEIMDDGDFYEKDGLENQLNDEGSNEYDEAMNQLEAREKAYKEERVLYCKNGLKSFCRNREDEDCEQKVSRLCGNDGVPVCAALQEKFNAGAYWTCSDGHNGGIIFR